MHITFISDQPSALLFAHPLHCFSRSRHLRGPGQSAAPADAPLWSRLRCGAACTRSRHSCPGNPTSPYSAQHAGPSHRAVAHLQGITQQEGSRPSSAIFGCQVWRCTCYRKAVASRLPIWPLKWCYRWACCYYLEDHESIPRMPAITLQKA